jgi:hypothetical protein
MKLPYIAAIVSVGAIALGAATFATSNLLANSPPPPVAAPAPAMPVPQRHTLADMMELPDGISYDDAARRLGTVGHSEVRALAVDMGISQGGNVAVYAWPNADGSRIVLVFQHDRLVHRAQEGLR